VLLLYPVFIALVYLFGDIANSFFDPDKEEKPKLNFIAFALNLISGYAIYLLLVHLLNFLVKNLLITSCIVAVIFLVSIILHKSKIHRLGFNKFDYAGLGFALLIGFLMGTRDFLYGNPDNFHIAFTASIAENNIYPPIFPSTYDMTMSSYHYGVDLIGAIFQRLFFLNAWDAQSLQIFFDASLCIITLYALVNYFLRKSSWALLSTLVATFYTSINSIDFFAREIGNFLGNDKVLFFQLWLIASWTSVSHMTSQLRLPSQNSAFFFAFALIIFLAKTIYERKNYYLPIVVCAFGLYFTFPAFFYPIFAALGLVLLCHGIIDLKNKKLPSFETKAIFFSLLALITGKFLTITGGSTNSGSVDALVFAPSQYWINWGKSYLSYFYDSYYLKGMQYAFDYAHPAYHPKTPIFSSVTFREFGFDGLVALVIVIYQLRKKKLDFSVILFTSAFISMLVPLCMQFTPRPVETTRFLHWTKIAFVIFNCIHVPYFFNLALAKIQEIKNSASLARVFKIGCLTILLIMLVPGIVSVIPKDQFIITGPSGVPIKLRPVITNMQRLHKSGDVCLDTIPFKHGHNISEIAGFYGPGGQMYKSDDISRKSAMLSFNPALLEELKVNYILMGPQDQITIEAAYRLANREVFEKVMEMNVNNEYYTMYKFNAAKLNLNSEERNNLSQEYFWILGCDIGEQFEVMRDPSGKFLISHSKDEILKLKAQTKESLKTINPVCAFWLKEQIALTSMLEKKE
jgi:hypothetical protein